MDRRYGLAWLCPLDNRVAVASSDSGTADVDEDHPRRDPIATRPHVMHAARCTGRRGGRTIRGDATQGEGNKLSLHSMTTSSGSTATDLLGFAFFRWWLILTPSPAAAVLRHASCPQPTTRTQPVDDTLRNHHRTALSPDPTRTRTRTRPPSPAHLLRADEAQPLRRLRLRAQ